MRIIDMLQEKDVSVSFEVFPPKEGAAFEPVQRAVGELSMYHPDFISVTYGAGGGTSSNTIQIASHIQNDLHTTALAHLSCVSSTRDEIAGLIDALDANQIENVLALRGDLPADGALPGDRHYRYAYQLVKELKQRNFCIGAACYPEGHVESENKERDLGYLKEKVDCGVDFLVTQMFFDNTSLYSFLYRALKHGIDLPVAAGVMPVTSRKQINRICALSGTTLTPKFKTILDKFGDDPEALKDAGIAYAIDQIIDLVANGVKGIHIYTMNKPEIAQRILESLSHILARSER